MLLLRPPSSPEMAGWKELTKGSFWFMILSMRFSVTEPSMSLRLIVSNTAKRPSRSGAWIQRIFVWRRVVVQYDNLANDNETGPLGTIVAGASDAADMMIRMPCARRYERKK